MAALRAPREPAALLEPAASAPLELQQLLEPRLALALLALGLALALGLRLGGALGSVVAARLAEAATRRKAVASEVGASGKATATAVTTPVVAGATLASGPACVLAFGADPSGKADSSAAFHKAIGTGRSVYVPAGTYRVALTVHSKLVMFGDGSSSSWLVALDAAQPVITYCCPDPQWDYHSEFRALGLRSCAAKQGIGFTMGRARPEEYVPGDELVHCVKFYGAQFVGFDKGLQFPFGNIGTELYSCGVHHCRYGVYSLNNKFGANDMHAGCKYFYAGEISNCDVGAYFHDSKPSGGIVFRDTILENNAIACYVHTMGSGQAILFSACWFEANGDEGAPGAAPRTVELDQWDGAVRSTKTVPAFGLVLDGSGNLFSAHNCGLGSVLLLAHHSRLVCRDCFLEQLEHVGDRTCVVQGEDSCLLMEDPRTWWGVPRGKGILVQGLIVMQDPLSIEKCTDEFFGTKRWGHVQPRFNRLANTRVPDSPSELLVSFAEPGAKIGQESASPARDGIVFPTCCAWSFDPAAEDATLQVDRTAVKTAPGVYVLTFDLRVLDGNPSFSFWDGHAMLFARATGIVGEWCTVGAVARAEGELNLRLDVRLPKGQANVFRLSALQLRRFDTRIAAEAFFKSLAYGAYA